MLEIFINIHVGLYIITQIAVISIFWVFLKTSLQVKFDSSMMDRWKDEKMKQALNDEAKFSFR
jgi:hypothetical protein